MGIMFTNLANYGAPPCRISFHAGYWHRCDTFHHISSKSPVKFMRQELDATKDAEIEDLKIRRSEDRWHSLADLPFRAQ